MNKWMQKLSSVKSTQWLLLILSLSLLLWTAFSSSGTEKFSSQEEKISFLLSEIEGAGKCSLVIYYDEASPAYGSSSSFVPKGALVVSQGAHDISVQLRLRCALQALLQLPQEAIEVFPMEE